MVEMTETAVLKNNDDARAASSVLDEIGPRHATYDGLARAWGRGGAHPLPHTRQDPVCDALSRADRAGRAARRRAQLSVSVKEAGDHIIFLRKVEPGKADRSYGIEVARLARPAADRDRARPRGLKLHERTEHVVTEDSPKAKRARCRSSFSSPWVTASPSAYGP